MGLTHYWQRALALPPAAFGRALEDCRKILPPLAIAVGPPAAGAAGQAALTTECILVEPPAGTYGEPLLVRRVVRDWQARRPGFGFAKTNRLPYDRAVRVVLIILRRHIGLSFHVYSDDPDWQEAQRYCQEHLGYGLDFRLDR